MHDVIIIKRQTGDSLICGTRIVERIVGALLSVLAAAVTISGWIVLSVAFPVARPALFIPSCLFLLGLHVAFSTRSFTFSRDSQACVVRITLLGVLRRQRTIRFSQVVCHRQWNWQGFWWLYQLVLTDRQQTKAISFTMGYASSRSRAEALARNIATFTNTQPIDAKGHVIVPREDKEEKGRA